jgi:hypothetical protein
VAKGTITAPAAAVPPDLALGACLRDAARLLSGGRCGELALIADRWQTRGFVALVVGEFKRGKSTLLNALLGQDLLPTGVPPVTAVPTRVLSGPRRRATVRFLDGTKTEIAPEAAGDYVEESRNPANRRGVASVEIAVESGPPEGVVLVDVPGLGSIHRHNTERALTALPEADAAIVVAAVDPPIGEAELRLLGETVGHAVQVELVLNKVDYLDEVGRRTAEEFTRRALDAAGFRDVAIWLVSARDGLRARLSHDDVGWKRSGLEALSAHLTRFFRDERESALGRSLARKAGRLVEQEGALLDVQRAAARRSSTELSRIADAFRSRRATCERDCGEARIIFRRRFDEMFRGYSERAAEAWREPRGWLESRVREIETARGGRSRARAWKEMEAAAREAVEAFMEAFSTAEARRLAGAYERLCLEIDRAAAESAEAVWRLAADLLPFEPPSVEPPSAPPAPRPGGIQLGSLRLMLDDVADAAARLLPRGAAMRRLAAHAYDEARCRYGSAVESSRDAFRREYEPHFRRLLRSFEECARETARAIEIALAAAESRARAVERGEAGNRDEDERRDALRVLAERLRRIRDIT